MSAPDAPKQIQFVHSIHPDNAAYFNSLAPSSKDIRNARSNIHMICTTCRKSEEELGGQLRKCGKCHVVWYCSRECQTLNWARHKPTCGEAGIPKLIRTFMSNRVLQLVLQECFILDLNLLQRARVDEPLFARVDVAVEPSDILDFAEILLGKGPVEKKFPGMLQVNGFTPATSLQTKGLTPQRQEMWRQERARARSEGFSTDPVALVEIAYADSGNSITFPFRIHSAAKKLVKQAVSEGFKMISAVTGETTTVHLPWRHAWSALIFLIAVHDISLISSYRFMNTHIRADKKNQLLLRTEMRPFDIQVIRDAVASSNTVPAMALNEKLAREKIYKSLHQMLVEHRRAVAAGALVGQ